MSRKTPAFVRRALDLGAPGIEVDVIASKTGSCHPTTTPFSARRNGRGRVMQQTFAHLRSARCRRGGTIPRWRKLWTAVLTGLDHGEIKGPATARGRWWRSLNVREPPRLAAGRIPGFLLRSSATGRARKLSADLCLAFC